MHQDAAGLALWPAARAEVAPRLRPAGGVVRLRANENPYGPGARALEAAAAAADQGAYYPGPIEEDLLGLIAARHGLSLEHMVLASGSNEALCAAAVAFGRDGALVVPALTYSPHLRYAAKLGVEMRSVPLRDDMGIDLAAMRRAVDGNASLVYICNPNNPTGMTIDGETLRAFCRSVGFRAVVLVDEACNELTDDPEATSMVDLVRAGENVIVTRTFSKIFGMAGMRIGYVMAPPRLADIVRDHVMSWSNVVGRSRARELPGRRFRRLFASPDCRGTSRHQRDLPPPRHRAVAVASQFRVRGHRPQRGRIRRAHARARGAHPRGVCAVFDVVAGQRRAARGSRDLQPGIRRDLRVRGLTTLSRAQACPRRFDRPVGAGIIGNRMVTSSFTQDRLFKALADNVRREIVAALVARPMRVSELTRHFRISRPAVSRHLRLLKAAGLVEVRPQGRMNVYCVRTAALREIEEWLNELWASRLSRLQSIVAARA